jgi:cell division protein FtsB
MKKVSSKVFLISVSIAGILILLGFTEKKTIYSVQTIAEMLKKQTEQIVGMKLEIQQQKNTIADLTAQIENLKLDQRDYKVISATLQYYVNYINPKNPYCHNPSHLKKVWDLCKKWSYIAKDYFEAKGIKYPYKNWDWSKYMMAICVNETNFYPLPQLEKNADGSYDWGVTQVNDVNVKVLNKKLPKELQGKDLRYDLEANICARFLWIIDRIERQWRWLYWDKKSTRFWAYYNKIKDI